MSFFNFGFGGSGDPTDSEIPEIYPLLLRSELFLETDIVNTYIKILTDAIERTHGLPDKYQPLLWDNCLQSEVSDGLITLIAKAMHCKSDLFLVYKSGLGVIRKADQAEQAQIKLDYEKTGESKIGIYISFRNYRRTDMLKIYSALEYCVLASLHKTVNLSKAVQIKISDLRAGVSLADSGVAKDQAKSIAKALGRGQDILLDVKDDITTAQVDTAPTEKAIDFLDAKKAFILGMPFSYISGLQTPGIGSTGEQDMRAVERGLKQYFVSIIQPTIKALFGVDVEFKSQDFREMATALEALKTFDLVSDDNLSREAKKEIMARLFDLDPEQEAKALEADAAQSAKDVANAPKPQPPSIAKASENLTPNAAGY